MTLPLRTDHERKRHERFDHARLERFRREQNWTQALLAEELGWSERTVRTWLKGAINDGGFDRIRCRAKLADLQRALKCSLEELILPVVAPEQMPPPAAVRPASTLPFAASSFVGRTSEAETLSRLLTTERVVTVTGPCGCGKTRLVGEVVRAHAGDWDEVVFIMLDEAADPSTLIRATLRMGQSSPFDAAVGAWLSGRRVLWVLDTCDRVVQKAAELVSSLGPVAPTLQVVATSRTRLGVDGERELQVGPLPVDPDVPGLAHPADATRLFLDRARAHARDIDWTQHAEAVGTICRKLDGLPAALELAARQLNAFTPTDLARHLDDVLGEFEDDAPGRPERHRSLRAIAAWTCHGLKEEEWAVLRQLSTFEGGCDMGLALAVCAPTHEDAKRFLPNLRRLVAKSVVVAAPAPDGRRYCVPNAIRALHADQLGRDVAVEERYRRHCLDQATAAGVDRLSNHGKVAALLPLRDALRRALERSLATEEQAMEALPAASGLYEAWIRSGPWAEGGVLLAKLGMATKRAGPVRDRVYALAGAATLSGMAGDAYHALTYAKSAVRVAEEGGDQTQLAWTLRQVACALGAAGECDLGRSALRRKWFEADHTHDPEPGIPETRCVLDAAFRPALGHLSVDDAVQSLGEHLAYSEHVGIQFWAARANIALGWMAMQKGNLQEAADRLTGALAICAREPAEITCLAALRGSGELIAERRRGDDPYQALVLLAAWERADRACRASTSRGDVWRILEARIGRRAAEQAVAEGRSLTLNHALKRATEAIAI